MTATKKKSAPKVAAAEGSALETADLAGGAKAAEKFRAAAMALPKDLVGPFVGSARLMLRNASTGAANVLGDRDRARKELPALDLARVAAIPELALGAAWAAEEAVRLSATPKTVNALVKEATAHRALLLSNLDGLVAAGLVPAAPVAAIRKGRGKFDIANDCVAAAALFRKHGAALRGKTPVTAAHLKAASDTGEALAAALNPKGAARPKSAELRAALELRDRLAALLDSEHAIARRAGGWLFGEERDAKVPVLLSHAGHGRKKAPPAPAPTPPAP